MRQIDTLEDIDLLFATGGTTSSVRQIDTIEDIDSLFGGPSRSTDYGPSAISGPFNPAYTPPEEPEYLRPVESAYSYVSPATALQRQVDATAAARKMSQDYATLPKPIADLINAYKNETLAREARDFGDQLISEYPEYSEEIEKMLLDGIRLDQIRTQITQKRERKRRQSELATQYPDFANDVGKLFDQGFSADEVETQVGAMARSAYEQRQAKEALQYGKNISKLKSEYEQRQAEDALQYGRTAERGISIPPSQPEKEEGPSIGQQAAGLGAEVAIGASSQALGAALAPATWGISYPVLSFAGGFTGSLAAQEIEGRDTISYGRAIRDGLLNLIPAGKGVKAATVGGKIAKTAARGAVAGAPIGAVGAVIETGIEEQRLPTFEEITSQAAGGAVSGAVIGGAFAGFGEAFKSAYSKFAGKTTKQLDDAYRAGDPDAKLVVDTMKKVSRDAPDDVAPTSVIDRAEDIEARVRTKPVSAPAKTTEEPSDLVFDPFTGRPVEGAGVGSTDELFKLKLKALGYTDAKASEIVADLRSKQFSNQDIEDSISQVEQAIKERAPAPARQPAPVEPAPTPRPEPTPEPEPLPPARPSGPVTEFTSADDLRAKLQEKIAGATNKRQAIEEDARYYGVSTNGKTAKKVVDEIVVAATKASEPTPIPSKPIAEAPTQATSVTAVDSPVDLPKNTDLMSKAGVAAANRYVIENQGIKVGDTITSKSYKETLTVDSINSDGSINVTTSTGRRMTITALADGDRFSGYKSLYTVKSRASESVAGAPAPRPAVAEEPAAPAPRPEEPAPEPARVGEVSTPAPQPQRLEDIDLGNLRAEIEAIASYQGKQKRLNELAEQFGVPTGGAPKEILKRIEGAYNAAKERQVAEGGVGEYRGDGARVQEEGQDRIVTPEVQEGRPEAGGGYRPAPGGNVPPGPVGRGVQGEEVAPAQAAEPRYMRDRAQAVERAKQLGVDAEGTTSEIADRISKKEKIISFFDSVENNARERLRQLGEGGTLGAQKPIGMAVEYSIIGAAKFAKGATEFGAWASEMVREFGGQIKPYLRQIYNRSKDIARKNLTSDDEVRSYAESISKGLDMPPPKPPEGMRERKTVTRAASSETLQQEAAMARTTGAAYAPVTPVKKIAEDAASATKADPVAELSSIKSETDPFKRAARLAGYINQRAKENKLADAEFDELTSMGTDAGTILRTMRELQMGTPEGRGNLHLRAFIKFAESKGAKITQERMDDLKAKFIAAEKAEKGPEQLAALQAVVDDAMRDIKLRKRDWWDAYRYTNALSNPRTHQRNILGNTIQTALVRPTALLGQGKLKGSGLYLKEAAKAVPEAWDNFKKVFTNEDSVRSLDDIGTTSSEGAFAKEYNKKLPKALRLIPQFLEAQDRFFSTMIRVGETHRLVDSGLDPEVALRQATSLADRYLYRDKLGDTAADLSANQFSRAIDWIGGSIDKARKANNPGISIPAKLVAMFVRTPIKFAERGFDNSPFAFVAGSKQTGYGMSLDGIARARHGRKYEDLPEDLKQEVKSIKEERLGQAIAGTTITSLAAILAATGRTTWAPPKDEEERRVWYQSHKPYSILIGNRWVPMQMFGGFSLALAIPAAVRDAMVDNPEMIGKSYFERVSKIGSNIAKYYVGQTPLTAASDLMKVATGDIDYSEGGFGRSSGFIALQAVPASGLLRYVNQLTNPYFSHPKGFVDSVFADIPGLSERVEPYRLPSGEPVRRTLLDVLPPYPIGTKDPDTYKKFLERRDKTIEMRQNNVEMDRLLKDIYNGDANENDVIDWIDTLSDDEASRIKARLRAKDKKWKDLLPYKSSGGLPGLSGLNDSLRGIPGQRSERSQ